MEIERTLDKSKLIAELKEIHGELVDIYRKIFDYKYQSDEQFKTFIDKEYKENGVGSKEKEAWNDNFCHRASYTLLNKILFVRICEDKGFMLNPEDYIAGEPKDPHIGKKLSKIGLQKWANLVTNYTLGELIKFAFHDMKKSYNNIVLYKEDKYEVLNPTDEELSLKYLRGDERTRQLVLEFENVLNDIVEKLDTTNFNFKNTDGNILGDVYEKFMDRETRKALGQFYTPEFVIEYILKNTVVEVDVVENPFVSVADISCGSGHFLIMAYDILREKFINNLEKLREKYADEVYTIKRNGKKEELTGREYWKKENVHYHILNHCIYGADIDSFAVQLTTINLLLKDLDNFTDELNIVECDSLIKWEEDYDWQDLKEQLKEEYETVEYIQQNLLGEEEKIVVTQRKEYFELKYKDTSGLERTEKISRERAEEIVNLCEFWSKKFDYVVGNPPYFNITKDKSRNYDFLRNGVLNISSIFIFIALKKLSSVGKLGYIVPKVTTWVKSYSPVIKELNKYHIESLSDVGIAFDEVGGEQVIFIIDKKSPKSYTKIHKRNDYRMDDFSNEHIIQEKYFRDDMLYMYLSDKNISIYNKIKNNPKTTYLGIISDIFRGAPIQSKKNCINEHNDKIFNHRILGGRNIERYYIRESNYINIKHSELNSSMNQITRQQTNRIGIQRLMSSKIRIVGTILGKEDITYDTITNIVLKNNNIDLYYVLGFINSNLLTYYLKYFIFNNSSLNMDMDGHYVGKLPIIIGDHNKGFIGKLVKKIMENKAKIKEIESGLTNYSLSDIIGIIKKKDSLVKENEINEHRINNEVYKLFGLDDKEIKEIEQDLRDGTYGKIEDEIRSNYRMKKIDFTEEEVLSKALDILKNKINPEIFINEHIKNNKAVYEMALEFGCQVSTLLALREYILQNDKESVPLKYYNMDEIYIFINKIITDNSKNILNSRGVLEVLKLKELLEQKIDEFEKIIMLCRKDDSTKKSLDIIKGLLNSDSYTWNAYRKAKAKGKVNKTFVKYYDSNYYGLSEWSDEIHKKYFLDAIEEYTVNNPNEKKAKDILKLFKDLDIEDKQDYIEIIEGKIKRAFH
jgi:hypothetical protein